MTDFPLHDESTAPQDSQPLLEDSKAAYGMVPNLHGVMAEAPTVLQAYKDLHGLFVDSSLEADEKSVVWLSVSTEHECHYCVPAHTGIAKNMGVSEEVIEALRKGTPLPNTRLEALRDFTLKVTRQRGDVDEADVQAFLDAGFTRQQVLEVILGLTQKVMSNYINHLAQTPVDKAFKAFEWEPETA